MKISEQDLAELVARFLLKTGGQVFAEVASLGQSADLVWIRGDAITFVEVKINATHRAIEQCRAHELVADYICIATSNRAVSLQNRARLEELGYGLVSCRVDTGQCVWIVEPTRLAKYWSPIREKVMTRIVGEARHAS